MRLRKKQWRNPVVIYTDEMVVGKDFQVFLNMEYFIEKLAGVSEYVAGLHVLYRGWGDMAMAEGLVCVLLAKILGVMAGRE